jgi:C4-type Zn-finger protein
MNCPHCRSFRTYVKEIRYTSRMSDTPQKREYVSSTLECESCKKQFKIEMRVRKGELKIGSRMRDLLQDTYHE